MPKQSLINSEIATLRKFASNDKTDFGDNLVREGVGNE